MDTGQFTEMVTEGCFPLPFHITTILSYCLISQVHNEPQSARPWTEPSKSTLLQNVTSVRHLVQLVNVCFMVIIKCHWVMQLL